MFQQGRQAVRQDVRQAFSRGPFPMHHAQLQLHSAVRGDGFSIGSHAFRNLKKRRGDYHRHPENLTRCSERRTRNSWQCHRCMTRQNERQRLCGNLRWSLIRSLGYRVRVWTVIACYRSLSLVIACYRLFRLKSNAKDYFTIIDGYLPA
eukprot:9504110-Pyramimonas_sp.AAC.2